MSVPELRGREGRHSGRAVAGHVAALRNSSELRAVVLTIGAIIVLLYLIRAILLPFVLAGIVAYVCTPLIDWLAARTRLPRTLLAVVLFLLLIGLAATVAVLAGQSLFGETGSTVGDLQGTVESLLRRATGGQPLHLFGQSIDLGQIVQGVVDRTRAWLGQSDNVGFFVGTGFAAIMGVFLTPVLLIWFLLSGPAVARGLLWTVPPARRELVLQIWQRLDPVLKRYFIGILAVVIYAMIASYIGLALILGVNHAVLLALLTGMAETLPIIGSTAVAIIAGLVALHSATGIMSIVAFAIYATVLRLSIDQVMAPLVLGRAAHVHGVLVIFCFLAGAVTFGITGIILSVPVALTIKATLATLYGETDEAV